MKSEEFEQLAGYEGFDLHQWTPGCYSDEKTAGAFEGYQMRQPEIDALKFDQKICRSLYSNASREIERLRQENTALRAENEMLRDAADRAEGFLFAVSLMPQLGPKVQEVALKHHEALRSAIQETK